MSGWKKRPAGGPWCCLFHQTAPERFFFLKLKKKNIKNLTTKLIAMANRRRGKAWAILICWGPRIMLKSSALWEWTGRISLSVNTVNRDPQPQTSLPKWEKSRELEMGWGWGGAESQWGKKKGNNSFAWIHLQSPHHNSYSRLFYSTASSGEMSVFFWTPGTFFFSFPLFFHSHQPRLVAAVPVSGSDMKPQPLLPERQCADKDWSGRHCWGSHSSSNTDSEPCLSLASALVWCFSRGGCCRMAFFFWPSRLRHDNNSIWLWLVWVSSLFVNIFAGGFIANCRVEWLSQWLLVPCWDERQAAAEKK